MIMITPFIEVRKSDNKTTRAVDNANRGVFTTAHFDTNQVILKFTEARIRSKEEVEKDHAIYANDYLQINKDLYLDLAGDITRFIQHSCNPNTSVKIISRSAFLISTRAIKPNEELTFDFSITSDETPETWQVDCKCGSWNCRKTISGFNTLSDKEQEWFLKQGIVPKYVKQ